VLCMPRGCTSALLFIGKGALREAPRNTALVAAQAQAHIGHRRRYSARYTAHSTVLRCSYCRACSSGPGRPLVRHLGNSKLA
jgi:hypothetical protein